MRLPHFLLFCVTISHAQRCTALLLSWVDKKKVFIKVCCMYWSLRGHSSSEEWAASLQLTKQTRKLSMWVESTNWQVTADMRSFILFWYTRLWSWHSAHSIKLTPAGSHSLKPCCGFLLIKQMTCSMHLIFFHHTTDYMFFLISLWAVKINDSIVDVPLMRAEVTLTRDAKECLTKYGKVHFLCVM